MVGQMQCGTNNSSTHTYILIRGTRDSLTVCLVGLGLNAFFDLLTVVASCAIPPNLELPPKLMPTLDDCLKLPTGGGGSRGGGGGGGKM